MKYAAYKGLTINRDRNGSLKTLPRSKPVSEETQYGQRNQINNPLVKPSKAPFPTHMNWQRKQNVNGG